jgi:TPR repeat protein
VASGGGQSEGGKVANRATVPIVVAATLLSAALLWAATFLCIRWIEPARVPAAPATSSPADKEWGKDVAQLREAAAQGLAQAQYDLGRCYRDGTGVRKDALEAVKWYRKAAEQGHAEAQHDLGRCYLFGQGVPKDEAEGVKWWRKAAEQGYAWAQYNLGIWYQFGQGVRVDEAEAVKWYRKAAEQGHAMAQYKLGVCYHFGRGVPVDDLEAVKWYRKAAEQGLADAQYNLGVCYYSAALEWYSKAAQSFLKKGNRARAVTCYDRMKGIAPDHFLTRQLFTELYPERPPGKNTTGDGKRQ